MGYAPPASVVVSPLCLRVVSASESGGPPLDPGRRCLPHPPSPHPTLSPYTLHHTPFTQPLSKHPATWWTDKFMWKTLPCPKLCLLAVKSLRNRQLIHLCVLTKHVITTTSTANPICISNAKCLNFLQNSVFLATKAPLEERNA